MRSKEVFPALGFAAIGLFVMWSARGQGVGSFYYPGAGLMPFCWGTGLTGVSLLLLYRVLKGKAKPAEVRESSVNYRRVAGVVVVLLAYALFLDRLGYLIATPILFFLLMVLAGSKKIPSVVFSVVTVIATYFFFTYFGLVFPPGLLKYLGL
ncbi:MAG TPA: tripartite tricarboxylate transporter TctB family protein [Thermodesulfobacteriota bacterium]|nr:tripartite tricarboxylate transporter TctB family protein [Thermodesulfobacteriota bacterium]